MIDPYQIIQKYYPEGSLAAHVLIVHSEAVAGKSDLIAQTLGLQPEERNFIREAALLHDIGIILTQAPDIGCFGNHPYICHGYLGHDLLIKEGLPIHALVCERHTGTGLTIEDIENQKLPIPRRTMLPVSLAEKIIAYTDKFFSKSHGQLTREKTFEEVLRSVRRFGPDKETILAGWHEEFNR